MKTALTWLLLLAGLAAVCAAQSAEVGGGAPGLAVTGFDWKYSGYDRAETVNGNESIPNNDASTSVKLARRTIYVFKYAARLTVKNSGDKAVKAVSWDHVFTDAKDGKELKRYRLQSKQQIPPGETLTLTREVGLDPKEKSAHISMGKQGVEITRVEYADGTSWKKQ